jgi:hypothetical protein
MVAYSTRARFTRTGTAIVMVLGGALLLSACSSSSHTPSSPGAHSSPAPTHSAGSKSTPTAPKSTGGTPVTLTCDQILSASQLYAFNPNFGVDPNYAPTAASLPATIVGDHGVSCGWLNQSSGDVLQIAVGEPPSGDLDNLKDSAIGSSNPVPTYGVPPQVEGYFAMRGTSGEVQVFTGKYWVVSTSTAYQEPGDAAPVMQSVLQNLPSN